MVGIHFSSYQSPKRVLDAMMSCAKLAEYCWNVKYYIPLTDDLGIEEGLYSPPDLKNCIANLSNEEIAEGYCLFGMSAQMQTADDVPLTFDSYLNSSYSAALVCTDICLFDFYCKDANILIDIQDALIRAMICSVSEIEILRDCDRCRTGFYR